MKIGILTFTGTQSHGACLQAYALKTKVAELGGEAAVIPYRCAAIEAENEAKRPQNARGLKKRIGAALRYPVILRRWEKFHSFEERCLELPAEPVPPAAVYEGYERIIVGSDQVWNPTLTGMDRTFFLDGAARELKYSYAASLGMDAFPAELEDECLAMLADFRQLNVREKALARYLAERLPGKTVQTVLDPTLLLDRLKWERLAGDEPLEKGRYLLLHAPAKDPGLLAAVRSAARENGLKIVFLTNRVRRTEGMKSLFAVSPEEYVNLIRFADCVVTGSFHTLCFSLIFERTFWCTGSMVEGRSVRITDLLETAGLTEHLLAPGAAVPPALLAAPPGGCGDAAPRLAAARAASLEILKKMTV